MYLIYNVKVNNTDFIVNITIKRKNRRIYLRVKDGQIHITTPTRLSAFSISEMIKANFSSIIKAMQKTAKVEDEIHYLGKKYQLVIKDSSADFIYVHDCSIVIETTNRNNVLQLIETFYTTTLKNIVKNYVPEILIKFNLPDDVKFGYKNVKGYFGECYPKSKKIILATRLAKYDLKYILSVIYHEFAHFKYQNHQAEFYHYLEQIYPNYRKIQREMRSISYNEVY